MLRNVLRDVMRRMSKHSPEIDNFADSPYYDESDLARWITDKARALQPDFLDHPALVHIETLAVCNAACSFCPYDTLARKGTRMPDALIEKIIDDLTEIPRNLRFHVAPFKVSDPFLETRLFDILARINEKLPNAAVSLITNGAAMTERNLAELARIRNVAYLNVSLNFHDPVEYQEVMKLPLERTLARLDTLRQMVGDGRIGFPVRISRVSDIRDDDEIFIRWVQQHYPEFRVCILPRNDWIGGVATGNFAHSVPDVPCHRWFDFSIMATGQVALCCMDGKGEYPKGDVNTSSVLEIYNQPWLRELRRALISRRASGAPCDRCTYLSY